MNALKGGIVLAVMVAAGLAGAASIEIPVPLQGGTVPNALVLTGDNASGTGTLRIRPSDEDTQLVLCEASNNASPEVCSSWQHYNASATGSGSFFGTNLYLDSAGAVQNYNNSLSSAYFQTVGTTTGGGAYIGVKYQGQLPSTANFVMNCYATGATAATCTWGSGHTVTNDFRGPILNGGSASCNGISTGSICLNDDTMTQYSAGGAYFYQQGTVATVGTGSIWVDSAGSAKGSNGYYGASFADADYADKTTFVGYGKQVALIRSDDVAASTAAFEFRDNAAATGAILAEIEGDGALDVRGAIKNEGSATCNGIAAGGACVNESATVLYSNGAPQTLHVGSSAATSSTQIWEYAQGTSEQATTLFATGTMAAPTVVVGVGYYGSTYTDSDYADKGAFTGVSKMLAMLRSDDVAATAVFREDRDNVSGTGVQLGGVYGDGADFKTPVTPTALSGDVNDYAGCTLAFCRIGGGAANRNITGLASGAAGKAMDICNIGTTNTLVLVDESASSTAANRFALDANITIPVERCQRVIYDGTSSRWRAFQ